MARDRPAGNRPHFPGALRGWRDMELKEYVDLQLAEALGADNRWYCSEYYGHAVTERETLLRYYISHGGAADFARRWRLAEAERQWLHAVHGVRSYFGI